MDIYIEVHPPRHAAATEIAAAFAVLLRGVRYQMRATRTVRPYRYRTPMSTLAKAIESEMAGELAGPVEEVLSAMSRTRVDVGIPGRDLIQEPLITWSRVASDGVVVEVARSVIEYCVEHAACGDAEGVLHSMSMLHAMQREVECLS